MSRKVWPLAALAMVALISAACSDAAAHSGTASSGANNPAASSATRNSSGNNSAVSTAASTIAGNGGGTTNRDQAVKFAECMRKNGIRQFPDPDASGALTIDAIANGSSVDTDSAVFKQAMSACKDLQPPGFTGNKRTPEQQKAALQFAQCIRDNGVKDFPDPEPDGPMVDTNRIPSAERPGGMSILNAAMKQCRGFAAAAGVTGGR